MFCPSCVWSLWLLSSSPSQAVGLGRYLCASAAEQPQEIALGASRGPFQATFFHERRPWPDTAASPPYPYMRQETWQRGHDTFPFFSPHLSICQKHAFHSGEKRTPVCSVHLRRIPSRRSSMHNMHCCWLSSRQICSGRVKWQPQVEGKFCSKVFVLTKDKEEEGN